MTIRIGGFANSSAWRSMQTMISVAMFAALWMAFTSPAWAQSDEPARVTVCDEANGTLVDVSEEAANLGQLDFSYHLATADEIAAGACDVTASGPEEPEPGSDGETARVVVCNEANGTLVEVSEESANLGQIDFPYHLATADEIAAGVCAVTTSEPDTISLTIFKFNCPNAATGNAEAGYAGCKPGGNATFQVATAGGNVLGSCTTEVGVVRETEVGYCYVGDVPFGTQLVITEDESTGFVPLENPKTFTIERPGPGAADYTPTITFVNLPAADLLTPEPTQATPEAEDEPDTVTTLPETGTGTSVESSSPGPLLVALSTLMMTAVGLRSLLRRS